jgi:hypothetical protein
MKICLVSSDCCTEKYSVKLNFLKIFWLNQICTENYLFYVTDGNIMYLIDASRFLISCVIQHYAPVVGWGGVEEQMHNVDYDPGP